LTDPDIGDKEGLTLDDLDWWPKILRPLVAQYGGQAVRRIGLETLGYPPDVFGVTYLELRQLAAALTERT